MEIDPSIAGGEHLRRDQLLLQKHLSKQNRDLRVTKTTNFHEMEELLKNYESMNLREEDWSKFRTLSMNSRPEFKNCRMKFIIQTILWEGRFSTEQNHPTLDQIRQRVAMDSVTPTRHWQPSLHVCCLTWTWRHKFDCKASIWAKRVPNL